MSKSQQADSSIKQRETLVHAKTMLSAVLGAIIGCGASLHTYYNLLGGADQVNRLAQVELTVEHNRLVGEQTLAVLKEIQAQGAERAAQEADALSKKPTQRELSDALDGLFESLPEGSTATSSPEKAAEAPSSEQQQPPEQAGDKAVDGESNAAASNEAAGK